MAHRTIQKAWAVAVTEWGKWLRNPRMMIALMLVIVARTLAVEPLNTRTAESGLSMNIFEPMIAVGNSGMLVMLLPAVFLILMSDYPVLESNSLLYLSRTGKRAWFWGADSLCGHEHSDIFRRYFSACDALRTRQYRIQLIME